MPRKMPSERDTLRRPELPDSSASPFPAKPFPKKPKPKRPFKPEKPKYA